MFKWLGRLKFWGRKKGISPECLITACVLNGDVHMSLGIRDFNEETAKASARLLVYMSSENFQVEVLRLLKANYEDNGMPEKFVICLEEFHRHLALKKQLEQIESEDSYEEPIVSPISMFADK